MGFETTRLQVFLNGLYPHSKDSLCATTYSDEVQVDLLHSSGCTLVFEACQVLVELAFGEPATLTLSSYLLCLVVAEATFGLLAHYCVDSGGGIVLEASRLSKNYIAFSC